MLRFYPEKTKIIFFDLEYYVPARDRERITPSGMTFSPVLPGHKILGGVFLTYFPMQDRVGKRSEIWEWSRGSEKEVLHGIYELLQQEWKSSQRKDQSGLLMLSGIGISHSDVPALVTRLSSSEIVEHYKIHDLMCGCRQIDLSTATYCQFSSNHSYFAYPKTKSQLFQKYLSGKKLKSGKCVWDLYERKNYEGIERRCEEEVDDSLAIYKAMFDLKNQNERSLKQLKRLRKAVKKGISEDKSV